VVGLKCRSIEVKNGEIQVNGVNTVQILELLVLGAIAVEFFALYRHAKMDERIDEHILHVNEHLESVEAMLRTVDHHMSRFDEHLIRFDEHNSKLDEHIVKHFSQIPS
jgi:hypothetical protein